MVFSNPSQYSPYSFLSNIFLGLKKAVTQINIVDTPTSGAIQNNLDYIEEQAGSYASFFTKLMTVMESTESKKKMEPTGGPPKTPDRPIPPVNSDSTDSTTGSGASSQGKPEEPVKELASELIARVLGAMMDDFKVIKWSKSPFTLRLAKQ